MKLKGGKLGINWAIMSIIAGHHHWLKPIFDLIKVINVILI
jgi:hypothetical protein